VGRLDSTHIYGNLTVARDTEIKGNITKNGIEVATVNSNVATATKLETARSIELSGDVTGSANFDGSGNVTITATVVDDSHNHVISNVDGLQTALDGKSATSHNHDASYLGIGANAVSATKLATSRTISLSGDATGSIGFDGTGNVTIPVVIADDSHNHVIANVDGLQTALDGKAATTYVDEQVAALVDSSPATLNTLNELAAALGDDPNFATTVTNSIATKLPSSSYTASDVLTKIKTVDGSGSGLDADLLDGIDSTGFMRSVNANGYYGLARPSDGDTTEWIRTTQNGLIPYQSGGHGALGTSAWPFSTAYINTIYESGTSLASKYLGISATAASATKLATARTISLGGDVTGSTSFDGTGNVTITAVVEDDSHNHVISNIDGLQALCDGIKKDAEDIAISSGAIRIEAVSRGSTYNSCMALTKQGRIIVWGAAGDIACNGTGGYDIAVYGFNEIPFVDYDTSYVVDHWAVGLERYVLFANGNLYGFGRNTKGQLGTGDLFFRTRPNLMATNVIEIAGADCVSNTHEKTSFFFKTSNNIWWMCGQNDGGRIGSGDYQVGKLSPVEVPIPAGYSTIAKLWNLGASNGATYVEVEDGSIFGCGYNTYGYLGVGVANTFQSTWTKVVGLDGEKVIKMQGGFGFTASSANVHSCCFALTESGKVFSCGDNDYGQLGLGLATTAVVMSFTDVGLTNISDIVTIGGNACSIYALSATKDKIYVWGYNGYGQLGLGDLTNRTSPVQVNMAVDRIMGNTCGQTYSHAAQIFLILTNGELWSAGENGNGAACRGGNGDEKTFGQTFVSEGNIKQIQIGGYADAGHFALMVTDDGRMYGWGYNGRYNILGIYNSQQQALNPYPRRMF
jgi:alpha-tubulin suppressor-like RCC1 family protein